MKYLSVLALFSISVFTNAQTCDTVVVMHAIENEDGHITDHGYTVDSIRNGHVVFHDSHSIKYYFDSLQRISSIVTNLIDSTAFSYNINAQLYKREYFNYSSYFNGWRYKIDNAMSVNYYRTDGSDSLYVRYKWDGYSMIPFYKRIYFYSNNILERWQVLSNNGWGFNVDSTFDVYFTGPNSRVDSGWVGVSHSGYGVVYKYDALFRLIRIEELVGNYFDGFQNFAYQCGELSSYYNSCLSCHSGGGFDFTYDSACNRLTYTSGYSSMTTSDYTTTYYSYADCNHLLVTAPVDKTICEGDTTELDGKFYGGHNQYHVQWSPSAGLESDTTITTHAFPDSTTTYIVTVTDSAGLINSDTIIVFVDIAAYSTLHVESIDSVSTCQTALLVTDSVAGNTYTWFNQPDGYYNELSGRHTVTENGEYVLYIHNQGVCPGIYDTINVNSIPDPGPDLNLLRGCGYVVAISNEPVQLQWTSTNSFTYGLTNDTIFPSTGGDYNVIATDSLGCHSNMLTDYYAFFTHWATNSNSCPDSCNASISAYGGWDAHFLWNTGDTVSFLSDLCPGIYSVIIQDENNCVDTITDTVSVYPRTTLHFISTGTSNSSLCDGVVMAVDSTNSPYGFQILWSDSTNDLLKDSVCPGWNYFYVSDWYTGCLQYDSVFVNSSHATDTCHAQFSVTNNPCPGQSFASVSVNMDNGFPFGCTWQVLNNFDTHNTTLNNLSVGTYSCVVIDSTGCVDTASVTISDPLPLNVTYSVYQSMCNDSCAISLNVSGGSLPYQYKWCNNGTLPVSNSCDRYCDVLITDADGCLTLTTTTQPPVNPLLTGYSMTAATCPTCTNGQIHVAAIGGIPPYTYYINSISNGPDSSLINLSPGMHYVCVNGADSCTVCDSVLVTFLIGVGELGNNSINIYPNPSKGYTMLNVTGQLVNATYEITDLAGQILKFGKISDRQSYIDIPFPAGTYLLIIKTGNSLFRKKLTIIN
jgi:hypothetical protein